MLKSWQTPKNLLIIMTIAMTFAFATWMALLNNFVIERASFTGKEIGILQSIREIPGFMAFSAVFVLLLIKEQTFAYIALALLGIGVAITGYFPSASGLYLTTFLMSVGFHYYETVKQSLSLQWLTIDEAPGVLGKLIAVSSIASLMVYSFLWVAQRYLDLSYEVIYLVGGGGCLVLALIMWLGFPRFESATPQRKHLLLRKRYWLFYALTFMSGARRQIFMVFAGFLMVEKFGYSVSDIAALFMINHVFNWAFAGRIGLIVGRIGERRALTFEYCGLFCVFIAYAFVNDGLWAGVLYVADHLFFSLAIAIKTYFQKIADPADMASTAGVAFTINHIAAVFIPVLFGLVWLVSPMMVFLMGAIMAVISLILARNIPIQPRAGCEVLWGVTESTESKFQ
ncbi:MFS transporter [Porticoccaceae bacterium]|nr:MFS transporter [Porticoccaceae bacterium]MDA8941269.1 MFS transporter [Porticoccaceae bacterium]MDA9583530.1 MFS transporter [Porticoccaceae bacterium]MDB2394832.1 MFS transporter [Porticoccaceae bacterium]